MQECRNAGMQKCPGIEGACPLGRSRIPGFQHSCILAFLHLCILVLLAVGVSADEIIERVLARVVALGSGDVITQTDVTAARDLGLVEDRGGATESSHEILSRLIDRSLMLAEVDRYAPPEPSADAV